MSRALVIKGTSFSTNKVTTVEFDDPIPCTGISLSSSTFTITDFDPVTIGYTVTPADTTDAVTWTSSNTNVVTVSEGVMTVVGIGICTVTATCGNYSATATITVSISITPVFTWGSLNVASNHLYYTDTTSLFICSGTGDQAIEYNIPKYGTTDKIYPLIIPRNTAKIRISRSGTGVNSLFYNANRAVNWLKNEFSGDTDATNSAKNYGPSTETVNLCTSASGEFTVPEGVGAFVFNVRCASSYPDTSAATVAENMGLTFEYLTASNDA